MAYILLQDQGHAQWTGSRWSWSWRREWRTASAAESEVRLPLALCHSALLTVPKEKSLSLSRFPISSPFHALFHSACCCCLDSCQEQLSQPLSPIPVPNLKGRSELQNLSDVCSESEHSQSFAASLVLMSCCFCLQSCQPRHDRWSRFGERTRLWHTAGHMELYCTGTWLWI